MNAISRRNLLLGAGTAALAAGCSAAPAIPSATSPYGVHQAGVETPAQRHCTVSVWNVAEPDLAALGREVGALHANPALSGLPVDDLTATIGLGPKLSPAVAALPEFLGDQVAPNDRGGDLLLQVCASDPVTVSLATGLLGKAVGGTVRWRQTAFLGPGSPARNILGFPDGIVQPAEPAKEVWLDDGGTIAVLRRMRLKVADFLARPVTEQERVFGRRKSDGTPLSGGADVDLGAKRPDGQYLIPADAHVRLAHPMSAGVPTMLRRSYNYDNGDDDRGLLFISFQRELRTFVNTAYRMADGDALLRYATTTASAAFHILPGFSAEKPLGS
ncbi:Dyp-type peroxidase [Amycolatopsis benzoatilytica]|uniref:Dyp-type peroxidase n=1 Tax=Amycolatopsis benzoatilytica TaxID=346045 RepID=UPI001FE06A4A|nr:Dyp-type peroxidase [Amycolatopsis benzoatilytica]